MNFIWRNLADLALYENFPSCIGVDGSERYIQEKTDSCVIFCLHSTALHKMSAACKRFLFPLKVKWYQICTTR